MYSQLPSISTLYNRKYGSSRNGPSLASRSAFILSIAAIPGSKSSLEDMAEALLLLLLLLAASLQWNLLTLAVPQQCDRITGETEGMTKACDSFHKKISEPPSPRNTRIEDEEIIFVNTSHAGTRQISKRDAITGCTVLALCDLGGGLDTGHWCCMVYDSYTVHTVVPQKTSSAVPCIWITRLLIQYTKQPPGYEVYCCHHWRATVGKVRADRSSDLILSYSSRLFLFIGNITIDHRV